MVAVLGKSIQGPMLAASKSGFMINWTGLKGVGVGVGATTLVELAIVVIVTGIDDIVEVDVSELVLIATEVDDSVLEVDVARVVVVATWVDVVIETEADDGAAEDAVVKIAMAWSCQRMSANEPFLLFKPTINIVVHIRTIVSILQITLTITPTTHERSSDTRSVICASICAGLQTCGVQAS